MKKNFPINIHIHRFLILSKYIIERVLFKFLKLFTKLNEDENEIVIPRATYAPWKKDLKFKNIHYTIRKHTLCDVIRLYYIYEFCNKVNYLKGDAIEIGCWKGGVSLLISKVLKNSTTYVCDTFCGVVKVTTIDTKYQKGMHSDTSQEIVEKLFNENKISNYKILKGVFPEKVSNNISQKKFKFAHIDTDTYKSTLESIKFLWPKIVKGGVVVIDDYGVFDNKGIKKIIEEDLKNFNKIFTVRLLSGQALLIKN